MSLKNIKQLKSEKGFTIVELLIVIVVIGILAAIVIVAFNGVQQQARTTAAKANAQGVIKAADTFNAECPKTGACTTSGYPTAANLVSYSNASGSTASLPTGFGASNLIATAVTSSNADGKTLTYIPKSNTGVCVGYWDSSANNIAWLYGGNATGTAPSGSPLTCP